MNHSVTAEERLVAKRVGTNGVDSTHGEASGALAPGAETPPPVSSSADAGRGNIQGGNTPGEPSPGENVWRSIAGRAGLLGLGALLLAGIGVYSARAQPPPSDSHSGVNEGSLAGPWLAPDRTGSPAVATMAFQAPTATLKPPEPIAVRPATPNADPHAVSKTSEPPPIVNGGLTADGKVILNLANAQELALLPGIGEKRAQKILALREKLKRFRKATDLLRIRGIGVKSLKKMLPHLVVDPPVAAEQGQDRPPG